MKLEVGILCIVAATSLLFLLTLNPNDEDGRVVLEDDEQVWMRKNHLMLPSKSRRVIPPTPNFDTNNVVGLNEKMNQLLLPSMQWRPVGPPSPNSAINTNPTLGQQNFADLPSAKENLFLPSMQTWRPVSPPKSNTGHNSVTPIGEINFASSKSENQQVLLPSLEKGQVSPPGPNPGNNFVSPTPNPPRHDSVATLSRMDFARSKLSSQHILLPSLQKGPVTSPGSSPIHNPITPPRSNPSLTGEKTFARPELKKQQVLLPSLERGPVTPPTPNPGHNSVTALSGTESASSKKRSQLVLLPSLQKGPVTSPGFSPGHNSVPPIGEKSFAYLKMIKNRNLIPYSQKLRPTTPPGTDVEQNSSGCNMGTKKKFAARKMGAALLPPVDVSLKASY